jgi:eukaryotic-like serine/threonine-protein kinase
VLKRFERESRLAGKLSHPNVTPVLDVGEVDGVSFMVMDLAVGINLGDLILKAPFGRARTICLLRQLLDGLDHAHTHGLIHRDLKPDNVIVDTRGGADLARIVDFGIAVLRDSESGDRSAAADARVTTGGLVLGTPHYMAPELAVGRSFDHRVDLYALGVIAYEMLTARLPFDGTGVDVVHACVHRDAPTVAERVPWLPVDADLEAFTLCLLARDPNARPSSAAAARAWLDKIERRLSEAPPPVPKPAARANIVRHAFKPLHVTPPEALALGSAQTVAITTLERPAEPHPVVLDDAEPIEAPIGRR